MKVIDQNGLLYFYGKIKEYVGAKIGALHAVAKSGSYADLINKPTIPTKTTDLINDAQYMTPSQVETQIVGKGYQTEPQVQGLIDDRLEDFSGISYEKVDSVADLPETGVTGVFYLVPNSGDTPNSYDEYIWVGKSETNTLGYENIGPREVDLSGYLKTTDIVPITNQEIDEIVK
ncbi:hypothetical protein M2140_000167 [Clostridiales Family XIII bacterium PM5-7]